MLPEALRPPLSQLWKVDIYCEKWLEMALIYPCLGNRASERHPHMAPEQCQAVAHKMHAMLRANPFFWGALEHRACVPTPILQRLLFSVVAAYLANPQFETDSKMIRLALEIFEQELVIPPESYRPFLLLVVEFRTILLARDMTKDSSNNSSGQDSNDGNQLELDFKRPLPSAHQASEHLPSYLAALNSRWEAIDEMIADGQDLIAAFSMHNFIQECKYGLAAMAIELNTLYPSGVVRDMLYTERICPSIADDEQDHDSQLEHVQASESLDWDASLIPQALHQYLDAFRASLAPSQSILELERELKQIEQRRLDINSRIAALRSEQEASSLGMATNLAAATLAMETPSRPSTKSGNQHFSGLVDYAASPYETELSAHVEYDSTAMVNEVHNGSPLAKSSRPMRVSKKHRSSPRTFTKAEMQLVEQALTEFKGDSVMLYKKHGPKGDGRLEGWSLLELNTQIRAERQRRTEASVDLWPFERAL